MGKKGEWSLTVRKIQTSQLHFTPVSLPPPPPPLPLTLTLSLPPLGHYAEIIVVFGSSGADLWLAAVRLLWETGRQQGEVGKDPEVAATQGGFKHWRPGGVGAVTSMGKWMTTDKCKRINGCQSTC